MEILNTLDRFYKNKKKFIHKNTKVGLISNQCSYSFKEQKYSFELLEVQKVFLLEHGFFSELQDQVPINNLEFYQQFKHIDWISLYGKSEESLKPQLKDIQDIEVFIIDIQDVGSRYYTFLTSAYYFLKEILEHNLTKTIIILDRPNPLINNFQYRNAQGSPLQEKYESFVGIKGVLHQHGLFPSELLYYYWIKNNTKNNHSKIYFVPFTKNLPIQQIYPEHRIVKETGNFTDFNLYFDIYPSPNMPSIKTAKVYSGQCLLEGTNLSEGRGTTKPFEIFGAPYIDTQLQNLIIHKHWDILKKLGIILRKIRFIPVASKYVSMPCNGWQIHIADEKKLHPLMSTMFILKKIKENSKDFDWYRGIYEYKNEYLAIQYLLGDDFLINFFESSKISLDEIYKYFKKEQLIWQKKIKKFLLYNI